MLPARHRHRVLHSPCVRFACCRAMKSAYAPSSSSAAAAADEHHHHHHHHQPHGPHGALAEDESAAAGPGAAASRGGAWLCCMPCAWLRGHAGVHRAALTAATLLVTALLVASPVLFLITSQPRERSVALPCETPVSAASRRGHVGTNGTRRIKRAAILRVWSNPAPSRSYSILVEASYRVLLCY